MAQTVFSMLFFLSDRVSVAGRLLDERDFQPPALAEGESDAGFSQMPFDTQAGTQGGTQANLLTRFGAVDMPAKRSASGMACSYLAFRSPKAFDLSKLL